MARRVTPPWEGGVTVVVTWVVWWAGIVFVVALFGKVWCTVCPWNALADWLNRNFYRFDK